MGVCGCEKKEGGSPPFRVCVLSAFFFPFRSPPASHDHQSHEPPIPLAVIGLSSSPSFFLSSYDTPVSAWRRTFLPQTQE